MEISGRLAAGLQDRRSGFLQRAPGVKGPNGAFRRAETRWAGRGTQGRRTAAPLVPCQHCRFAGSSAGAPQRAPLSGPGPHAPPGPRPPERSADTHHPPAQRGAAERAGAASPPRAGRGGQVPRLPWCGRPQAGGLEATLAAIRAARATAQRAPFGSARCARLARRRLRARRVGREERGGPRGAGDAGAAALGPRTPRGLVLGAGEAAAARLRLGAGHLEASVPKEAAPDREPPGRRPGGGRGRREAGRTQRRLQGTPDWLGTLGARVRQSKRASPSGRTVRKRMPNSALCLLTFQLASSCRGGTFL